MELAITYYKDIPMSEDEKIELIGRTVLENFLNEDVKKITFVKFDKEDYAKWLKKEKDTQNKRAEWATRKINPSLNLNEKNRVEKICEICEEPFIGTKKSKFCSNACKQKNKYKKSKK